MKIAIRYGTFETNSSSEHTLVVFDNPAIKEMWIADAEAFLDLRRADWVDELNDEPEVFFATADDIVRRGEAAWEEALEGRVAWHNDIAAQLGLPFANSPEEVNEDVVEMAIHERLVPSDYWKPSEYSSWDGWGVSLFNYEVEEWSSESAKAYAEDGYDILQVTVGDNH